MFACFGIGRKKVIPIEDHFTTGIIQRTPSQQALDLQAKERRRELKKMRDRPTGSMAANTSATTSTHGAGGKPSYGVLTDRMRIQARRDNLPKEIAACLDAAGYLHIPFSDIGLAHEWSHMDPNGKETNAFAEEYLQFVRRWIEPLMQVIVSERAPALTRFQLPDAVEGNARDLKTVVQVLSTNPVSFALHAPENEHHGLPQMLDFFFHNLPTLRKAGLNTVYLDATFNQALKAMKEGCPDYVAPPREQWYTSAYRLHTVMKYLRMNHYVHLLRDFQSAGIRIVPLSKESPYTTARAFLEEDAVEYAARYELDGAVISRYFDTMATAHLLMESVEMMDKMNQDFLINPNSRALALVDSVNFQNNRDPACNLLNCLPAPVLQAENGVVCVRLHEPANTTHSALRMGEVQGQEDAASRTVQTSLDMETVD